MVNKIVIPMIDVIPLPAVNVESQIAIGYIYFSADASFFFFSFLSKAPLFLTLKRWVTVKNNLLYFLDQTA